MSKTAEYTVKMRSIAVFRGCGVVATQELPKTLAAFALETAPFRNR